MDTEAFRKYGREMVDYIANYLENVRERPVVHEVKPGYLKVLTVLCTRGLLVTLSDSSI